MTKCAHSQSQHPLPSYSNLYQCVAILSGSLITISIGMHYGWPSPSLPLLLSNDTNINTTNSDGSWIVVMPLIGLPFGCFIALALVDRIGRKTCLLISSPIILATWLIIAFTTNIIALECGRFLAGIVDGLVFVSIPMYISELADKKIRGLLWCSVEVSYKFGILAMNVIGIQLNVKEAALVASSVPIIHFLTFFWMPESPYFLAAVSSPSTEIHSTKEQTTTLSPLFQFIDVLRNKIGRKAFLIILGLMLVKECSGYLAIGAYCLTIFNEADGTFTGSTSTIIYFGVQVVFAAVSGVLVDRVGRKPLLITSVIGSACALAAEGTYFYLKSKTNINLSNFGLIPLTALVLYTATFSLGLGTVPLLLTAELFPTRNKAVYLSITNIMFAVIAIGVSKFFQLMKDEYGMHVPFFVFTICCAFGLIFVIFCVPETKGKALERIQRDLASADAN